MNDKSYDENELVRLCGLLVDEQLNEADAQRLSELLSSEPSARTFYRSYMEAHARLLLHYEPLPVDENAEGPRVRVAARQNEVQRSQPISNWRWLAPIAVAASLLLALGLWWLWPPREQPPMIAKGDSPPQHNSVDPPNPPPPQQLAIEPPRVRVVGRWQLTPTGDADFQVIEPELVRLNRGELLVESLAAAPAPTGGEEKALRIKTPHGEAVAEGTRFYIGTHAATTIPNSIGAPSVNKLTRILVLVGTVTLTNALGSVTGSANDLLAAEADKAPAKIAAKANSDFAIDYYKQQAKTSGGENIFFSPYSISTSLMMVQEGARGQTAQEIGNVLGFPKAAQRTGPDSQLIPWQTSLIHSGLAEIDSRLVSRVDPKEQARLKKEDEELSRKFQEAWARYRDLDHAGKKAEAAKAMKEAYAIDAQIPNIRSQLDPAELITANALWVEKTYGLSQNFVDTLNKHYKTGGAFGVDFIGAPDAERQRINEWVSQQTQGLIKDVLPQGSVSDQTRAVLTNTIYFNARWVEKFDPGDTEVRDFHLANGKTISVPMMAQDDVEWCRFGAFTKEGRLVPTEENKQPEPGADGFRVLEMPYKNGTASMLLIVPEKPTNLAAIESILTPQTILEWTKQLKQTELSIILIPKFKMRTGYELSDPLSAMGMPLAFDRQQADFTGMQASPSEDPLYLDQVYHQAFVEVSEEGTIAAAATAAAANRARDDPEPKPEFRADRPFLFMIRDNETGTILFMGRMMNPAAK